MRGVYTAGVLDFFQEQGVQFESVYGVSAGAIQACSYLSGQKGRGVACIVNYLKDWRYCSFWSLLLTGNLFGVKMCYDTIPNKHYPFDYETFAANPSRFFAVVTDVKTGRPVYRRIEDMRKDMVVIRASGSLPFMSRMVKVDGRLTLDGGVADSIPLEKAIEDGYQRSIVVLTQDSTYQKKDAGMHGLARLRYPLRKALRAQMRSRHERYNEQLRYVQQMREKGQAFVIQPGRPVSFSRIEKDAGKLTALYRDGYDDAKRLYPQMMEYLKEK